MVCQLLSLCNCAADHDGNCLGTCGTFIVTMLNCCRGELALSCSLCVGWHKRNLSSLAAASWRQEMGFWDTEEECGRERGWEIFKREGARLSQHYDFRRMMIYKGRHRRETRREDDTRMLYKHYGHALKMLRKIWAKCLHVLINTYHPMLCYAMIRSVGKCMPV